jgi:hypothetical protein
MTTLGRHVVALGGQDFSGYSASGTFVLHANGWKRLHIRPSPSHRTATSLAWDAARKEAVLFGGVKGSGWLGDTWTLSHDRLPPPRS